MEYYKDETRKAYNKLANEYEKKFKEHFDAFLQKEVQDFVDLLPPGGKVLDLGSGPGIHSLAFKEQGLDVLCFDISEEMVKLCRDKGLEAIVGDFENIPFPNKTFDGIWAYTSLLHTTRNKFPIVLAKIKAILKPKGIFGLAMKEGIGEDFRTSDKNNSSSRWFALYKDNEIRSCLKDLDFEILSSSRSEVSKHQVFLDYLCRKLHGE